MLARSLSFAVFLGVGGLIGAIVAAWPGALVGVVLMALLAFYFDALRLWRLQNWLVELPCQAVLLDPRAIRNVNRPEPSQLA